MGTALRSTLAKQTSLVLISQYFEQITGKAGIPILNNIANLATTQINIHQI